MFAILFDALPGAGVDPKILKGGVGLTVLEKMARKRHLCFLRQFLQCFSHKLIPNLSTKEGSPLLASP